MSNEVLKVGALSAGRGEKRYGVNEFPNIHAPNEFYRPERFRLGLQAWARLWCRLSNPQI